MAEDKMVGWLHRLNGHKFVQVLGGGEGEGNMVCSSPWILKESDVTGTEQATIRITESLFCAAEINTTS